MLSQRTFAALNAVLIVTALIAAAPLPAHAAKDNKKAWIDPKAAAEEDPDFLVQGEYLGEINTDFKMQIGLQVIALGDGKFRLVLFEGGLPGTEGVKRDKNEADGKRTDEGVVFVHPKGKERIVIKDGVAHLYAGDEVVGKLKKIKRVPPSLGAKPPAGAAQLFDGTKESLEKHWKKGAKMTDDGLLMQGVMSTYRFQDATIHVEFLLPYKPHARGQGRGNSGLYVQGRYETQMLDSFGLKGKMNETGGIYSIKDPDLNMCFPPLSWQTYDIEFTAAKYEDGKKVKHARMTVFLNGVIVQDDVECDHSTTASPLKEGPEPGPVFLQNHGNPVRYRNIWILPKD